MNVGSGQGYESYFGPASELVDVAQFLRSTTQAQQDPSSPGPSVSCPSPHAIQEEWLVLADEKKKDIEIECRVDDLQNQLHSVIRSPRMMGHILHAHQISVQSVLESADTSSKRKRKRVTLPEAPSEHMELRTLQDSLDRVRLQSWPLSLQSALFVRTPKQADHNTLSDTKFLAFGDPPDDSHQALLFVTVYNTLSWGHRLLSRASQHVLLSSQSLGDLFDAIPCSSNEIPEEYADHEGNTHWKDPTLRGSTGGVICIEGVAYGDGQSEQDYSDKLVEHLMSLPATSKQNITKGSTMHDITLNSLAIRLHKPYWLLHAGDCEHFLMFEHIRLHHVSDPPLSKYPLTTQITPPLLDTCRACSKAPAVYAVCGDIRLGESPYVICAPCWRWMGEPRGDDAHKVSVVSLPKHELGWGGYSS